MLLSHMQRFTYSATGSLRWKRDVTEYADVLRNSHSPTTNAQVSAKLPFKSRRLGLCAARCMRCAHTAAPC